MPNWRRAHVPGGTFDVSEIPAGHYRVQVSDFEHYPHGDRLAGFFRKKPRQLTIEVPSKNPIRIELSSEWFSKQKGR